MLEQCCIASTQLTLLLHPFSMLEDVGLFATYLLLPVGAVINRAPTPTFSEYSRPQFSSCSKTIFSIAISYTSFHQTGLFPEFCDHFLQNYFTSFPFAVSHRSSSALFINFSGSALSHHIIESKMPRCINLCTWAFCFIYIILFRNQLSNQSTISISISHFCNRSINFIKIISIFSLCMCAYLNAYPSTVSSLSHPL